jgi:uncharacterized membrane protein
MYRQLLLFLHLSGVIIWVGGMFFAYFCLRPAAARHLEAAQRLPLWAATFERFLRYTAMAVVVILASGLALFFEVGFRLAPTGWHIMLTLGLVMTAIFGHVYLVLYPRLKGQCAAGNWPAAAAALDGIRRLVAANLVLAACTVAAAAYAR